MMMLTVGRQKIKIGAADVARLWSKVVKFDRCWEWAGTRLRRGGYGQIGISSKVVMAHRVSWAIANGDPGKLCVLHRCDNPPCVNPAHLFLGTLCDNVRDMDRKGRRRVSKGERHAQAKLTEQDVREIRRLHGDGDTTIRRLGAQFSVHHSTINNILLGRWWRHVK